MKLWDRRVAIVHYMIELTAEDDKSEVEQWKWLLKLLSFLTADGMSSDESETGVNGKIYRVTVMAWRSDVITKYMDHIDGQQYVGDKAGRSTRGAVPRPRELSRKCILHVSDIPFFPHFPWNSDAHKHSHSFTHEGGRNPNTITLSNHIQEPSIRYRWDSHLTPHSNYHYSTTEDPPTDEPPGS